MGLKNKVEAHDSRELLEYYEVFYDYLNIQIFLDFQMKHILKESLTVKYLFLDVTLSSSNDFLNMEGS